MQWSALQTEEEERKKRVQRVAVKKAAAEGKGFGLPPISGTTALAPKVSFKSYDAWQRGLLKSAIGNFLGQRVMSSHF